MPYCNRAINEAFIDKLRHEAANGGWWNDVLADKTLLIAVRGTYLNVYWQGQALFRVEQTASGLSVTTHEKFLIDPGLASQVDLSGGVFDIDRLVKNGFIRRYEGKATLEMMKRAAAYYAGREKQGCHAVAIRNAVIDCEIAFPAMVPPDEKAEYAEGLPEPGGGTKNDRGRIDIACLQPDGGGIRLHFWETKLYRNPDLRADLRAESEAPVCEQVNRYHAYLSANWDMMCDDYEGICRNLVSLRDMGWQRKLPDLVIRVAGGARLIRDQTSKVGLLIFDFDEAQRKYVRWQEHLQRLKVCISPSPVMAVGDPKAVKL